MQLDRFSAPLAGEHARTVLACAVCDRDIYAGEVYYEMAPSLGGRDVACSLECVRWVKHVLEQEDKLQPDDEVEMIPRVAEEPPAPWSEW